jgi:hypothetical protein
MTNLSSVIPGESVWVGGMTVMVLDHDLGSTTTTVRDLTTDDVFDLHSLTPCDIAYGLSDYDSVSTDI